MTEEQVREALSRAVLGGIVRHWHEDNGAYYVDTADDRSYRLEREEAEAFAAAIFAAEKVVGDLLDRPTLEAGDTMYARLGSTAIAFRITRVDRGELRAEAIRESTGG